MPVESYKMQITLMMHFVPFVVHRVLCDQYYGHKEHKEDTKYTKNLKIITALCCLFIIMQNMTAQVRLPRLVRDSMVLQRDSKINIWGWASKGEKVRIKFNGKNLNTTANAAGKWSLQLPSMGRSFWKISC